MRLNRIGLALGHLSQIFLIAAAAFGPALSEAEEDNRVEALVARAEIVCGVTEESKIDSLERLCVARAQNLAQDAEDADLMRSHNGIQRLFGDRFDGNAYYEHLGGVIERDAPTLMAQARAESADRAENIALRDSAYEAIRTSIQGMRVNNRQLFEGATVAVELQSVRAFDGVRTGTFVISTTDPGTASTTTFTYNHVTEVVTHPVGSSTGSFAFSMSGYVESFMSSGATYLSGSGNMNMTHNGQVECRAEDRKAACAVTATVLNTLNSMDQRSFDLLARTIREQAEGVPEDEYGAPVKDGTRLDSGPTFPRFVSAEQVRQELIAERGGAEYPWGFVIQ